MTGALIGIYSGNTDIPAEDLKLIEEVNRLDIQGTADRFVRWIEENRG